MFCTKCGKKLDDGVKFCMYCGSPVQAAGVPRQDDDATELISDVHSSGKADNTGRQDRNLKYRGHMLENEETQQGSDDENASGTGSTLIKVLLIIMIIAVIGAAAVAACYIVNKNKNNSHAAYTENSSGKKGQAKKAEDKDKSATETAENTETMPTASESESSRAGSTDEEKTAEAAASGTVTGTLVGNYDSEYQDNNSIHNYDFIIADVSWKEAFQDCVSRGGYLVHLNTDDEASYILNEIKQKGYENVIFYVGARRDVDGDSYYWVNSEGHFFGEALNDSKHYASYWYSGEPSLGDSQTGAEEYYIDMLHIKKDDKWYFNDISNTGIYDYLQGKEEIGYICEYDNN